MKKLTTPAVLRGLLILFVLVTVNAHRASAQTSLFSIPTTDVTPLKRVYLEFDFISHLERYQDGGFQAYTAKSIYGLNRRVEVGLNLSFKKAEAADQPIEIQPNIKWQVYNNESKGLAAAVGGVLFTSVAHRAGTDTVGMVYATLSKQMKGSYGPRFTGGFYQLAGQSASGGDKQGALVGYEQKLNRRMSFIADWVSGKNRFGYVSPGFAIALPKATALTIAYNIGNEGRKNNSLYFTIGRLF